jgi:hypothetical protein
MKTLRLVLAAILALGLGARAGAIERTIDVVPAATLLLPYFEVDPNGTAASGVTTIFTVQDANAAPVLAHVTLWSDYGIPLFAFDIYLTGYDSETVDLQQVLAGHLPQTASAAQDPNDVLSPGGAFSFDLSFPGCSGVLPYDPLPAALVADLRAELSGKPSQRLGGKCAGRDLGDGILRGYVTVDNVNSCSLLLPSSPGYFQTITTTDNYLFGNWRLIDRGTRKVIEDNLVAIEAAPLAFAPGDYTFYGRLVAWTATDAREPLVTTFGVRYANTTANVFPARTSLIVWRDHKTPQAAVTCGTNPPWFPLNQDQIVAFDDQENPEIPGPFAPPLVPFPLATQRVVVGGAVFPIAFDRGWIYLNANTTVASAGSNPPGNPGIAQAWVEVVDEEPDVAAYGVRSRTSAVHPATQLGNAGD